MMRKNGKILDKKETAGEDSMRNELTEKDIKKIEEEIE